MTTKENVNIDFYCQQYLNEQERTKFYDKVIQYPTTLLVVFVGAAFYSLNDFFNNEPIKLCSAFDWTFVSFVVLFFLSTGAAVYFLALVFHGFTRKYKYIPFTGVLANRELELYDFYFKQSTKKTKKKRKIDAKKNACREFNKNLRGYYIDYTEVNQRINDKRAIYYYYTRTFLFIDLILLIIIGIIGQLN